MRHLFIVLVVLGVFIPRLGAHDEEAEKAARMRMAIEEFTARHLVSDHESGKKKASEQDLTAAKDVIRTADERKAKIERERPEPPILVGLERGVTIDLPRLINAANREFL